MSDYLKALSERTLGAAPVVKPVIAPLFAAPINSAGAVTPESLWEETAHEVEASREEAAWPSRPVAAGRVSAARPESAGRIPTAQPETAESAFTRVEASAHPVESEPLLPTLPAPIPHPPHAVRRSAPPQGQRSAAPDADLNETVETAPPARSDEMPQPFVNTRLEAQAETPPRPAATTSSAEVEAEISSVPRPEIRFSPAPPTVVHPAAAMTGDADQTLAPDDPHEIRSVRSPVRDEGRREDVMRAAAPEGISAASGDRIEVRQASPGGEKAAQQPVKPETSTGDVKITIGRIEVRANFQPKPEPPKRSEPRLTLDEYLRTQNRRER